ncbi:Uncharacterised protein [Mycobacterium tuberculosis]|nr:Uncharacterised protein [Mycobacterium tuberculosis]
MTATPSSSVSTCLSTLGTSNSNACTSCRSLVVRTMSWPLLHRSCCRPSHRNRA